MRELKLIALPGIPEVAQGASLCELLVCAVARAGLQLQTGDIMVLAQKIVSKVEGRAVRLAGITPSESALDLASVTGRDARLMELVLRESRTVLRVKPGVIVVEHRLGFVMANAGIDQSNVPGDGETALLLPEDPDASARRLRDALFENCGIEIGVLVIDSFGRAWRNGVTGTAIGVAGLPALVDLRGHKDREGRTLKVTQVAVADELAAAASLIMGQTDEGTPAVLVRGFPYPRRDGAAGELLRPETEDLFR